MNNIPEYITKQLPPKSYTYEYIGDIEAGSVYFVAPKLLERGGSFAIVVKDNKLVTSYVDFDALNFLKKEFYNKKD